MFDCTGREQHAECASRQIRQLNCPNVTTPVCSPSNRIELCSRGSEGPMSDSKNLWGGRFTGEADASFAEFNASFRFDRRLFDADIRGSMAHCNGLLTAGLLHKEEADKIKTALQTI